MIYETCSMYITTSIKYIHMCIHITFSVLIKPLWRRCLKTFLNKLYENWTFSSHFGSLQHFWKLSNKRCRGLYPMDSMWNILYITAMLRKLEYVTPFSRPSDGLSIKIKRNCYHGSKMHMIGSLVASQTFPPPSHVVTVLPSTLPSLHLLGHPKHAASGRFALSLSFWFSCLFRALLQHHLLREAFSYPHHSLSPCHTLYFFRTLLRLLEKLHLFVCCCFTNLKLTSTRRGTWGIFLTVILSISNSGMNHSSHKKVHFLIPGNTIIQYKQVYILLKMVLFHCMLMWHHN